MQALQRWAVTGGFSTLTSYLRGIDMSNLRKKNPEICRGLAGCSGQMELPFTVSARQAESSGVGTRHLATVYEFRHSGRFYSNSSSVEALRRILDFAKTLPGR